MFKLSDIAREATKEQSFEDIADSFCGSYDVLYG
ncbi:hypothetical protein Mucpa_6475 [Mucilaginibacter paludis DSM 18603]|uniref:Uncharacterized protein n=1 Tax=Mucilaginibacter paludis DSM 18603 TaxID=714943 RepID=H1Y9M6_9SPHI|nr:hypothetical protein Mucpa_6475 [Mucilaginibacter paludis DSM 18603]